MLLAVTVHMTQCPWHANISPWWYQLEVVKGTSTVATTPKNNLADAGSSTKKTEIGSGAIEGQDVVVKTSKTTSGEGIFEVVRQNHEIQLCDNSLVSLCAASFNVPQIILAVGVLHYQQHLVYEIVQETPNVCFWLLGSFHL